MKQLLETIVYALVDEKNEVVIKEEVAKNGDITYKISASYDDVGRIIGKNGNTISAIRRIMKAYAIKLRKRVTVDVI